MKPRPSPAPRPRPPPNPNWRPAAGCTTLGRQPRRSKTPPLATAPTPHTPAPISFWQPSSCLRRGHIRCLHAHTRHARTTALAMSATSSRAKDPLDTILLADMIRAKPRHRRPSACAQRHPFLFTLMTLTAAAELGLTAFLITAGNEIQVWSSPQYHSL